VGVVPCALAKAKNRTHMHDDDMNSYLIFAFQYSPLGISTLGCGTKYFSCLLLAYSYVSGFLDISYLSVSLR